MTSEMAFLVTALPRRPPPRSNMYTGASVLGTEPGRCYGGSIVTYYNQVIYHGRNRKENISNVIFLLFMEEGFSTDGEGVG